MSTHNLPSLITILCRDAVEITFLTYFCYRWLRWLQSDKQKPLLRYFYSYSALWILSVCFEFSTLLFVLEYSLPLVMMLFVLVHQHTLQKNFVGLYKIKPAQKAENNWLQEIVRFCLQAQTDLYFLLEHTQSLSELVHSEITLHTPVKTALLQCIAQSTAFNPDQYFRVDTDGNLLGINVNWKKPLALTALEEQPLEKASYYLIDSDACMIQYAHKTRSFTIIIRQKIYPGLSATQVLQSITHYLHAHDNIQGAIHERHRSSSSCQPSA